jgi:hypothetical protein
LSCERWWFLFDSDRVTAPFVDSGAEGPAVGKRCGGTVWADRNHQDFKKAARFEATPLEFRMNWDTLTQNGATLFKQITFFNKWHAWGHKMPPNFADLQHQLAQNATKLCWFTKKQGFCLGGSWQAQPVALCVTGSLWPALGHFSRLRFNFILWDVVHFYLLQKRFTKDKILFTKKNALI